MLFDKEKVKKIINEFSRFYNIKPNTQNILPCFSKELIVDGIGHIAVIYNGDISITQKLILLALRTHNQIYLITDNNNSKIKTMIDKLNVISKENNYYSNVVELLNISTTTFYSMQKNFEYCLIIGTTKQYASILTHLHINSIFYQYGEYNIFVDNNLTDIQKISLKQIDTTAFDKDYIINYYNINDIKSKKDTMDKVIHTINHYGQNQNVSIFSTIKENTYYFINEFHCRNIIINSPPFTELEFDENNFVCKKNILFV